MLNKNAIKKYDQIYKALADEFEEDEIVKLINLLIKNDDKFIDIFLINLRCNYYEMTDMSLYLAKKVNKYKTILIEHMTHIFMAALPSEKSMEYAIFIYNELLHKSNVPLSEEMLISLMRHALHFPSNYSDIINIIRMSGYKKVGFITPIFYLSDEDTLIENMLERNPESREIIIANCIDNDADRCLNKVIKYYNLNKNIFIKLSFPKMISYIKEHNIDIYDKNVRRDMIVEAVRFSRFELLPYIFDKYLLLPDDWKDIHNGLYNNYFTAPFYQTLMYYMKKYDYHISCLFYNPDEWMQCTIEVAKEIHKTNYKDYEVKMITVETQPTASFCLVNYFQHYRQKNFDTIVQNFCVYLCDHNNRMYDELNCMNKMLEQDMFGWRDDVKISYQLFAKYTLGIFDQLQCFEKIIFNYNSLISMERAPSLLKLRLFNTIKELEKKITSKVIRFINKKLFDSCGHLYNLLYIDMFVKLNPGKKTAFEINEDSPLEDVFMNLILNSKFHETNNNDNYLVGNYLAILLQEQGDNLIASQVKSCLDAYVSAMEIQKILKKRNILSFPEAEDSE